MERSKEEGVCVQVCGASPLHLLIFHLVSLREFGCVCRGVGGVTGGAEWRRAEGANQRRPAASVIIGPPPS
ncbi:hypothetical protein O3P69_011178 [Scylla paramamosain]|uniref:Uncharacterized protein n=1 Tax=Scylla paramamosain TaxID=85552 RepID=A0AAW0SUU1_SCYPA